MAPRWPPKMGRECQTRNGDTLVGAPLPLAVHLVYSWERWAKLSCG
jgi:hypothetical protein